MTAELAKERCAGNSLRLTGHWYKCAQVDGLIMLGAEEYVALE